MRSLKWLTIEYEDNKNRDGGKNEETKSKIHMDVRDDATDLLCTKNKTVNFISIFGPARMGKSTMMNMLAGVDDYSDEIFRSSCDMETVATGVDISEEFMTLREFSKLNGNQEVDSDVLIGFVDTEGQGNNVKDKLLECRNEPGEKERNTIRKLLVDTFESINVWLFPQNGTQKNQENLLFNDFSDDWKKTFKDMRKIFSEQLSVNGPKHGSDHPWTGRDIAELTKILCKTLIDEESFTISSIFERMQIARGKKGADAVREKLLYLTDTKIAEEIPTPQNELNKWFQDRFNELLEMFENDIEGLSLYRTRELKESLDIEYYLSKVIIRFPTKECELEPFLDSIFNSVNDNYRKYLVTFDDDILKSEGTEKIDKLIDSKFQKWKDHNKNARIVQANVLSENARNRFYYSLMAMYPEEEMRVCDNEDIDARVEAEIKSFFQKLKSEDFPNPIIKDISTIHGSEIRSIASKVKQRGYQIHEKIREKLAKEVNNFQTHFFEEAQMFSDSTRQCEVPLFREDLFMFYEKLVQTLLSNFNDAIKDLPKDLVQHHRVELENFCRSQRELLEAENKTKIISFAQRQMHDNLEISAKKLKCRLPMKEDQLNSEWFEILIQSKNIYLDHIASYYNQDNEISQDELRDLAPPLLESLKKNQ
ncbi:7446_t:CDS:2 [Acaulospora colombiana]|uniref:7446_t:CDS:1 n=1 Tax=Acaulospora colombiana TaxID=27376 RepID=A0ACA9LFK0_9GLOM|nr:7446_t:CDS:2 [Acaulospora colombiana]